MIIKDYKYSYSTKEIFYTINVDGFDFKMHHEKTEYGSIRHTDIDRFLDELGRFDCQQSELVEDFVRFQNHLLMYGEGFVLENAADDVMDGGN